MRGQNIANVAASYSGVDDNGGDGDNDDNNGDGGDDNDSDLNDDNGGGD